jgi:hypothetical protein
MDDFVRLIQSVGFPIAVSIYLLWRYEQRMRDMTNVLNDIAKTLEIIKERVKD